MSVTKAANRTIPLPSNRMLLSGSGFIKSSLRILSSCALQFSVEIRGDKEGDRDGVPIIRSPFTALAVGYEQCVSFYALAVAREVKQRRRGAKQGRRVNHDTTQPVRCKYLHALP